MPQCSCAPASSCFREDHSEETTMTLMLHAHDRLSRIGVYCSLYIMPLQVARISVTISSACNTTHVHECMVCSIARQCAHAHGVQMQTSAGSRHCCTDGRLMQTPVLVHRTGTAPPEKRVSAAVVRRRAAGRLVVGQASSQVPHTVVATREHRVAAHPGAAVHT
jgi:hypothetical protein